ncbi:MAG: GpE family phage tail protein [Pelagimonas sp.]|jgi:hypothetical protein
MADLAVVFNWSPRDMDDMDIEELARWREKARVRHEAQHGDPDNEF